MSNAISNDPIVISSARWFWWIAGLSLVNTVMALSGSQTSFVIGLGITSVTDAMFANNAGVAIALALLVQGAFFLFGFLGQKEKIVAFYIGLAVYILDALIFVMVQDWMPVAFHALAIFYISKGIMQLRTASPATVS